VIVYLAKRGFDFTIAEYFRTWGRSLSKRVAVILYEDLPERRSVPTGTYIFSDLERLDSDESRVAEMLWGQLSERLPPERLLNHPARTLRRYDLLDTLADQDVNQFRAHRLPEKLGVPRSPVFLRHEVHHLGPLSPLMTTQREIERAVARATWLGHDPTHLLLVEFCDTSDSDGLFRKYSAFVIGERIIPREVAFSRHWQLQDIDVLDVALVQEERAYLEGNPHADGLREIARLANVDYGRFDYALRDGEIQVWEINTNPIVMRAPHQYREQHLPNQRLFANRVGQVFEELDEGGWHREIPVRLSSPSGLPGTSRTRALRERIALAAYWSSKGRARPLVRAIEALATPLQRPLLWLVRQRLRHAESAGSRSRVGV
jgi:hypothetical protein